MKMYMLVLVLSLACSACSLSTSSESLSDSVSLPFDLVSSVTSSSDDSSDSAFHNDVSDHARTVVAQGGDARDISDGVADIAQSYGVTDWEVVDATFVGIGHGLAKAGVSATALAEFQNALANNPQRAELIAAGFRSFERVQH